MLLYSFFATISRGLLANHGKDRLDRMVVGATETELESQVESILCVRNEKTGDRMMKENGGEVKGNRTGGRKEDGVLVSRFVNKHSMQALRKLTKHH